MSSKEKALVGFVEAAGYFSGLSQALIKNDIDVDQYYLFSNKFSYERSKYFYFQLIRFFYAYTSSAQYLKRNFSKLIFNIISVPFFIRCLFRYDYYFLSSQSFFFFWSKKAEFKVLRFFRRKVVFIFLGSDSRAHFLSGYGLQYSEDMLVRLTRERIRELASLYSLGFPIIDLPSTTHLHAGAVADFFKVGFPKDIEPEVPRTFNGGTVRVLHAPSTRKEKGSHLFKEIIDDLKREIPFEYVEISNLSNQEVLAKIRDVDLVIDEMYSDSLMAGIACEAAWLGTCYVVFGEKLPEMAKYYNWKLNNFGTPKVAKETIKEFILNSELRRQNAIYAQEFLIQNWSPNVFAKRILQVANKESIESLYIPKSIVTELCLGWGAPKQDICKMIKMVSGYSDLQPIVKDFKID